MNGKNNERTRGMEIGHWITIGVFLLTNIVGGALKYAKNDKDDDVAHARIDMKLDDLKEDVVTLSKRVDENNRVKVKAAEALASCKSAHKRLDRLEDRRH